jgi:quercetin dioxygenase-like cupin family protein
MLDLILKRFDAPDERRVFPKGRFELVRLSGVTIGRATYQPGWRWSVHVGASTGKALCTTAHVGIVLSGRAAVSWPNGEVDEITAGDVFAIPPGHDSWVIGDEPYVSLHIGGADDYAKPKA